MLLPTCKWQGERASVKISWCFQFYQCFCVGFEDCEESKKAKTKDEDKNYIERGRTEDFLTIGRHADGRSEGEKGWSERRKRKEKGKKPARVKAKSKRPGSHPEGQRGAVECACSW